MQLRWPELGGLANAVSLVEAQQNFATFGASEQLFVGDVRAPTPEDDRDPMWRPINEGDAFEGPDDSAPWPDDRTLLYYWRPTFWRAT
jgi:hypothetical protein